MSHGKANEFARPAPVSARRGVALFGVALLVSSMAAAAGSQTPPAACAKTGDLAHQAVRVIDGQSFVIEDGREVRLSGILAPQPAAGTSHTEWIPSREARTALATLIEGRTVELALSRPKPDRYGRLLAQVWVRENGESVWVQQRLLAAGHARASALDGAAQCLTAMLEAEAAARASSAGLWSNAAYRILDAREPDQLMLQRSSFVMVEGRVVSAAQSGGRLYLNFGPDWRRDFTISIPPRLLREKPEETTRLQALAGKRVRVRGWIERHNGPAIEVAGLGEIEVLDLLAPPAGN